MDSVEVLEEAKKLLKEAKALRKKAEEEGWI